MTRILTLFFLLCVGMAQAQAVDDMLHVGDRDGNSFEVTRFGPGQLVDTPIDKQAPLFIWLHPQSEHASDIHTLASALAERGAEVWTVDLLADLMLERNPESVRRIPAEPVAALMRAAQASVAGTTRPIMLIACERMSVPLLRGMREWERHASAPRPSVGAILSWPNLDRGAPIAGEAPEFLAIARSFNLPVMLIAPKQGAFLNEMPRVVAALQSGGAPVGVWAVPDVRDYYYMHHGRFSAAEEQASQALPGMLMTVAAWLAKAAQNTVAAPLDESMDSPKAAQRGLVARDRLPVPSDIVLADAQGMTHHLSELRGRVVLVNFWATWCSPCVEEIPSMNRLAAGYDPQKFTILSVNFKDAPEAMQAFMHKVAVDFPVLLDRDGQASAQWRVHAFPSSFLLDVRGRIRYSVNSAMAWDANETRKVIDALLAEKAK